MALSPLDIHNKEFSSKMRGYDKDEVNDFLAQIVKDYSSLIKDNEGLKKRIGRCQGKGSVLHGYEGSLESIDYRRSGKC